MKYFKHAVACGCAFMVAAVQAADYTTVLVGPHHSARNGWFYETGSPLDWCATPDPNKLHGSDNMLFAIDHNKQFAEFALDELDGILVKNVVEFNYSTFTVSGGSGNRAPYLVLNVQWPVGSDPDGPKFQGSLIFEPWRQTQSIICGGWQTWNVVSGKWIMYVEGEEIGEYELETFLGLSDFDKFAPGAMIVKQETSNRGGVRFLASVPSGSAPFVTDEIPNNWVGLRSYFDNVKINYVDQTYVTSSTAKRYDFQSDLDGDGFHDGFDTFYPSNTSPNVTIGNITTTVANVHVEQGGTIMDFLGSFIATAKNKGQLVNQVARFAKKLRDMGLITPSQQSELVTAATAS